MTAIPVMYVAGHVGQVAAEIGAACRNIGFFYVTGHPVSQALRDEMFAGTAAVFGQTDRQKRRVLYTTAGNRGHVPMKGEALAPSKPADLKEAVNIGLDLPADDLDHLAGRGFRAANPWPSLPDFRDAMLASFDACCGLGRLQHRAFAIDLGLAPGFLEDKLDRLMAVLRLLHYPPAPARTETSQLGAGEHADCGCATPDRPARFAPIRDDAFLTAHLSPTYEKSGLA